jgi:glyoxylase-like metal-dependent hydrolase (beta-lactamase superfamily II)
MLDGGSSRAHARLFLDALDAAGATRPFAVVYTHSHWDHVFGGVEIAAPIIAHERTAVRLSELAALDWSDEALDRRVAAGEASNEHAAHVKEELPSPRVVEVAPADIVFRDSIALDLGAVSVTVQHVGGDHSAESCVVYVSPDRLLFLGDATYASPQGALTQQRAFPLYDTLLSFGAELYVEGHSDVVLDGRAFEALAAKLHVAARAAAEEAAVESPDEDTAYFIDAFRQGRS